VKLKIIHVLQVVILFQINKNIDNFNKYKTEKYEIIGELSSGAYFGEVSCLSKYLHTTATVRGINNLA